VPVTVTVRPAIIIFKEDFMMDEKTTNEFPNVEAAPPPPPEVPPAADNTSPGNATADDKLWSLLAYVLSPLVPIIIMLMEDKKNRPYLKLHNMQALVAGVAIFVVTMVVALIPVVGCISPLIGLAGWVAMIYWGIQAYNGSLCRTSLFVCCPNSPPLLAQGGHSDCPGFSFALIGSMC
jgi:uncharacterized membrane protein